MEEIQNQCLLMSANVKKTHSNCISQQQCRFCAADAGSVKRVLEY